MIPTEQNNGQKTLMVTDQSARRLAEAILLVLARIKELLEEAS